MELILTTLGIMIFGIMTLSITSHRILTLSITKNRITTLNIITVCQMSQNSGFVHNGTHHNNTRYKDIQLSALQHTEY